MFYLQALLLGSDKRNPSLDKIMETFVKGSNVMKDQVLKVFKMCWIIF